MRAGVRLPPSHKHVKGSAEIFLMLFEAALLISPSTEIGTHILLFDETEASAELVLQAVETELVAECSGFLLGLGKALFSVLGDFGGTFGEAPHPVLGDFGGTCGGLSSCSPDGVRLYALNDFLHSAPEVIPKPSKLCSSIIDDLLRTALSEGSVPNSSGVP